MLGSLVVPLKVVVIDERARNGDWCGAPYPGHKTGCPKNCPSTYKNFEDIVDCTLLQEYNRFKRAYTVADCRLVVVSFNLYEHAEEMKKRPRKDRKPWTERQARSVLYWQRDKVDKPLEELAEITRIRCGDGYEVLGVPEAFGVQCFDTAELVNIFLQRNPQVIVFKMRIVAKLK